MSANMLIYRKRDLFIRTHPLSLNATRPGEADAGGYGASDYIGVDRVGDEYPGRATLLQQGSSAARPELLAIFNQLGRVEIDS